MADALAFMGSETHTPETADGRSCCAALPPNRESIRVVVDGRDALGTEMLPLSKFLSANAEYRAFATYADGCLLVFREDARLSTGQIVRDSAPDLPLVWRSMGREYLNSIVDTTNAQQCTGFEHAFGAYQANSKTRASFFILNGS